MPIADSPRMPEVQERLRQHVERVRRLTIHATRLVPLFHARAEGYSLSFAADWAEIYGYCFPLEDATSAFDARGQAGYDGSQRARMADALLLDSMPEKVVVLPPHLDELRGSVERLTRAHLRSGIAATVKADVWRSQSDRLRSSEYVMEALRQYNASGGEIGTDTALRIVKYHLKDAFALVQLLSGGLTQGLNRLRTLAENDRLGSWTELFHFVLDETALLKRGLVTARSVAAERPARTPALSTISYSDYLDGLAAEFTREINRLSVPAKHVLVLFSRSDAMRRSLSDSLVTSLDIEGEQSELDLFWAPDRLIAYQVFNENGDWRKSQVNAREFSTSASRFLALAAQLAGEHTPDPDAAVRTALEQFNRLEGSIDAFENLRLAFLRAESGPPADLHIPRTIAPVGPEEELVRFVRKLFQVLQSDGDIRAQIRAALNDLLLEVAKPSTVLEEVIGMSGNQLLGLELQCSPVAGAMQLSGRASGTPFDILLYHEIAIRRALELCAALKSTPDEGYRWFLDMIATRNNLSVEERLLVAAVYAALGDPRRSISELQSLIDGQALPPIPEALYLAGLVILLEATGPPKLGEALAYLDAAIELRPSEARYHLRKGVVLWRIARLKQDLSTMRDALETTYAAEAFLSEGSLERARFHNNVAYFEIDFAHSFGEHLPDRERQMHLALALEHIDRVARLLPPSEWPGDFYHTHGVILLATAKGEDDPIRKQTLIDLSLSQLNEAKRIGVARWTQEELSRDFYEVSELIRSAGTTLPPLGSA